MCDDPEMAEDPGESKVIKQLERTCRRLVSSEVINLLINISVHYCYVSSQLNQCA